MKKITISDLTKEQLNQVKEEVFEGKFGIRAKLEFLRDRAGLTSFVNSRMRPEKLQVVIKEPEDKELAKVFVTSQPTYFNLLAEYISLKVVGRAGLIPSLPMRIMYESDGFEGDNRYYRIHDEVYGTNSLVEKQRADILKAAKKSNRKKKGSSKKNSTNRSAADNDKLLVAIDRSEDKVKVPEKESVSSDTFQASIEGPNGKPIIMVIPVSQMQNFYKTVLNESKDINSPTE